RFKVNYGLTSFIFQRGVNVRGTYRLFKALARETFGYWEHGPVTLSMLEGIRRMKPEVVLATNNFFFTTYLCYLAKRFFHFPFVYMPITHIAEPWSYHPFSRKVATAADLVVACTDFEKKHLIMQGTDEKKIKVLPLGIDPQGFASADG